MKWPWPGLLTSAALCVSGVLTFGEEVAWWVVAGVGILGLGWIAWGVSNIRSRMFVPALCRIPKAEGVLLTFDDGPDPEYTPRILDILSRHQAKACFFLIGSKALQNPQIVRQIIAEGHEIGNHSMRHGFLFSCLGSKKMAGEIQACCLTLESISGKKIQFFRPPFGVTNPPLARALKGFPGMRVLGWTLRTRDTVARSPEVLIRRFQRSVKPGDVVLFHDRCSITAEALEGCLLFLKEKQIPAATPEILKKYL